jgi:hypothetical protein
MFYFNPFNFIPFHTQPLKYAGSFHNEVNRLPGSFSIIFVVGDITNNGGGTDTIFGKFSDP